MAEEKMSADGLRNPDFWKEYYQNVQGQIEKINNLLKDLWRTRKKIEAQNLPGAGNVITVRLPLQPVPAAPAADETDFLKKALLNDDLWNKLLASR